MRKAGPVVFACAVLMWVGNTFPRAAHINPASGLEAQQARSAYVQQLGRVDRALGLPDGSALIEEYVAIELKRADQQEKFWAHEAGSRKADDERDAAMVKLTASDNGKVLQTFLSVRDQVLDARATFDKTVEKRQLEPNNPSWQQDQRRRDADHQVELVFRRQLAPQLDQIAVVGLGRRQLVAVVDAVVIEKHPQHLVTLLEGRLGEEIGGIRRLVGKRTLIDDDAELHG